MISRSVLAVDPGSQGAAVRITESKDLILCSRFKDLPRNEWEAKMRSDKVLPNDADVFETYGYLENNHAMPFDYRNKLAQQMRNFGYVECILQASLPSLIYVDCGVWQRFNRVYGVPDKERFRIYVEKVKEIFGIKVTQDESSAYLIANYAWWQEFGY